MGVDRWLPSDMVRCMRLLGAAHRRSHYRNVKYDQSEIFKTFIGLQSNWLEGSVWVTRDKEENVNGLIACSAYGWWWTKRAQYASEVVFVSIKPGNGRKLLAAMELWAWTLPRVKKIELDISSDIHSDQTSELYQDCGYRKAGSIFIKERPDG